LKPDIVGQLGSHVLRDIAGSRSSRALLDIAGARNICIPSRIRYTRARILSSRIQRLFACWSHMQTRGRYLPYRKHPGTVLLPLLRSSFSFSPPLFPNQPCHTIASATSNVRLASGCHCRLVQQCESIRQELLANAIVHPITDSGGLRELITIKVFLGDRFGGELSNLKRAGGP
jgi:hypothetical protein